MKKEEFYEVLGDIDENAVKEAEQQPPKIKRHWGGIALATAACLCAVLVAGIMMNLKDSDIDSASGNSSSAYDSCSCSDADNRRKPSFADVDIYAYQNGEIIKQTQNVEYSDAGVFSAWLKLNGLADGEKADELAKMMHYNGDELIPAEDPKPRLISDSDGSLMIDESFVPPTNNSNGDRRCAADIIVPEEFKEFYNKIPKEQLDKSLMLTLQSYAQLDWSIDEIEYTFTSKADRESMQADVTIYTYKDGDIKTEQAKAAELAPEQIFDAWKKCNGIGDEVKLTECDDETIEDDCSCVSYKLRLTISAELENYYDRIPKEKLLETLEKTLRYNKPALDDYKVSIA
ncbi:MAG: hypothetical protein II168_03020, partial [Ruminococcus sp.]|nr:hypothetical protein [Ruminococcus sp.]